MKSRWTYRLFVIALLGMQFVCANVVAAAEPQAVFTETRTYDIFVDDKKSGQSKLTITRFSDGSEAVNADAKVTVRWTVFSYVYEFHGKEQWRDSRFEQLESRAVDGGRQLSLSVQRTEGGFSTATAKGKQTLAGDVQLTTNYWREPPGGADARAITVLDADNGQLYDERIEPLGQQELTIGGQRIATNAYRLKGTLDVELWFDALGYLVRQVGKEDGHPTELRLAAVQQQASKARGKER